jgi:hypothetical protein
MAHKYLNKTSSVGLDYTYITRIQYCIQNNSPSWCQQYLAHFLGYSTIWITWELLSILLVITSIWATKFLEKIKNIHMALFSILWTIKILYNAHLCIYNVVLAMCLTHNYKVPQIYQILCSSSSILSKWSWTRDLIHLYGFFGF